MPFFTNPEAESDLEWMKDPSPNFVKYMNNLVFEKLNERHEEYAKERPQYAWENELRNKIGQIQASVNLGMGVLTPNEWKIYREVLLIKLKSKQIPSDADSDWGRIIAHVDQEYAQMEEGKK